MQREKQTEVKTTEEGKTVERKILWEQQKRKRNRRLRCHKTKKKKFKGEAKQGEEKEKRINCQEITKKYKDK